MKKLLKVLLVLMLCFSVVGCGSSDSSKSSTTDKKVEETETERIAREYKENLDKHKHYKAGTYEVGKDIKAGEYCLFDDELDNARIEYEVRKTEYDEGEDTVASDWGFYTSYLILKKGEFIEFDGAVMFSVNDMPEINKKNHKVMLKVGKDITAGNYIIKPSNSSPSFEVLSSEEDSWGERNTIVTRGLDFNNYKKVKLKKGQYLRLRDCTFEKAK